MRQHPIKADSAVYTIQSWACLQQRGLGLAAADAPVCGLCVCRVLPLPNDEKEERKED